VQFLVIHQFDGLGDAGIEADNLGSHEVATPRSHPRMFNVTMVGSAVAGMVLREGTRGLLRNFIVQDFANESIDLRASTNDLSAEWPTQISIENSFFFNNGAYDDEVTNPFDNDDNGFVEQSQHRGRRPEQHRRHQPDARLHQRHRAELRPCQHRAERPGHPALWLRHQRHVRRRVRAERHGLDGGLDGVPAELRCT
jgi:hypothetical protein